MISNSSFEFPEISSSEIRAAARLLGLSESAFLGEGGDDPRKTVIGSGSNLDVAACPGSGKTTVLVAKLAILADRWRLRTKGICVLSHTNAARGEIEDRLGNTNAGRRLLSHPHFMGTIHKFVNEYLAIPWLRSLGYPVKLVDADICERRRWWKIPPPTRKYLENQGVTPGDIRIIDTAFNVAKKRGTFGFGECTPTYKTLQQACKQVTSEGYHCYDDMFVWARDLLKHFPVVRNPIRNRFPLMFLDEAQDNDEEQSSLLHEIFVTNQSPVIRQRFGDGNQAIYSFAEGKSATTYEFPDESIKISLPNSFRFGQTIANLADPLGIVPCAMRGQGPKVKFLESGKPEGKHTIFLFDDGGTNKVLDAYGALLLGTFSDRELREGTFTAIGMVHKQKDEETGADRPRRVGDYWSAYDPEIGRPDSRPKTFMQYVQSGLAASVASGEAHHATERIAEGILRLATMSSQSKGYTGRKHKHRLVLESIAADPELSASYVDFVFNVVTGRVGFSRESWEIRWRPTVRDIAKNVSGGLPAGAEADEFLSWGQLTHGVAEEARRGAPGENSYSYLRDGREVRIKVGSIHSIKGQTHAATLVLETAWYGRNLSQIMPWLCGTPQKLSSSGDKRQKTRLRTHYVAMTRPSHLLCLALHEQSLSESNGSLNQAMIEKLKERGWDVVGV